MDDILKSVVAFAPSYLIFGVIFPIWAAKRARVRGLVKTSRFAIISIFILLGTLGGMIALIASMTTKNKPQVRMKSKPNPWVSKLWYSTIILLVGGGMTAIGYGMLKSIESGTHGAVIIGFIPIPFKVVALLVLGTGVIFSVSGVGYFIYSFFNLVTKGFSRK